MIREEGHIGVLEGTILVFTVLSAMLYLQHPEFLIAAGGPAAWQVAVVMTLAGLLLFVPVGALAVRFPARGLAEISEEVAGRFLGTLLTLAVVTWLAASLVLTVRNFTETFIIALLPTTPPSALIIILLVCAVYASYRGLEPLARATQILFPVIAAGTLAVVLLSAPRADWGLIFPFWGYGLDQTITGGVLYGGMAAEAVTLLVAGYAFRSGRELRRSGMLGVLLFGIAAVLVAWTLVTVFGAPDAARLPFPMFTLARIIYLGRFFQRVEAVMVMFWFFAAAARIALLFHGTVIGLTGALRLPYYRPVIFPMALVVASFTLLPKDFVSVLRLERDWVRPAGLLVLGIPLLLLVLSYLQKKGGQTHAA